MPDLSEATPRPWNPELPRGYSVGTGFGVDPGVSREEAEANAALIVQAVNCHDDLIAALRGLLGHAILATAPENDPAVQACRAALAKAEAVWMAATECQPDSGDDQDDQRGRY